MITLLLPAILQAGFSIGIINAAKKARDKVQKKAAEKAFSATLSLEASPLTVSPGEDTVILLLPAGRPYI